MQDSETKLWEIKNMAKNINAVKVWKINLRIFSKKFKNLRDINFDKQTNKMILGNLLPN